MSDGVVPDAESEKRMSTYDVTVEEWPAGLRCAGNTIIIVNKYAMLHGQVTEGSTIVAINDQPVDAQVFDENQLIGLELPYKLTLQQQSGAGRARAVSDGTEAVAEVTPRVFFDVLLMYLSVFIDIFGVTVIAPVVPYLQPIMGFDDVSLGLLTSLYNAAAIPGAVIIGLICRRSGTRGATLFSLWGSCVTLAAQGVVVNIMIQAADPKDPVWLYVLLALRVVAGATGSSMPIAFTYIGMKIPQREKPRYMAFTSVALTVAVMFGPMVGGTLANFTPKFALPFYCGAVIAGCGALVAMFKLGDARPPPPVPGAAKEAMPRPVRALIWIAPLKMLAYGPYIILGAAYYMWKFQMTPEMVGAVVSLHGVIQSTNSVLVVPRIMKNFGAERTILLGALLIASGTAVVGFMPTWWSFQMVWSPICGLGFGCMNTGFPILADKFATMSTRASMNAGLFAADQISMFLVGAVFGKMLSLARETNNGFLFWWGATVAALLQAVAFCIVWKLVLMPIYNKKKQDGEAADKRKLALASKPLPVLKEGTPTEEDYKEWGKVLVDLLHKRGWMWKQKKQFVNIMLDRFIVDLPTDTYQHRMEVLWEMDEAIKNFHKKKGDIDEVFAELNLIVGGVQGGHHGDHVSDQIVSWQSESSKSTAV